MKEWVSVLRAADAAARWHVHQRRKGPAQEPYMNHLLEVASLVTEATGGTEPSIVIAALLHDAIEDQEVVCTENLNPLWLNSPEMHWSENKELAMDKKSPTYN